MMMLTIFNRLALNHCYDVIAAAAHQTRKEKIIRKNNNNEMIVQRERINLNATRSSI